MSNAAFLFAGYLIQEPYLVLDRFPGMRVATIDRDVHPDTASIRYELIDGVPNVTRFLTGLPDMTKYPGWVLNGYAIDQDKVLPELGLDGVTVFPSKYEYAKRWKRPVDGLQLLGSDVVDERCHPFSLLHFEKHSLDAIRSNGGDLNSFGLFETAEASYRFCDYLDRRNQGEGTVWQVWG